MPSPQTHLRTTSNLKIAFAAFAGLGAALAIGASAAAADNEIEFRYRAHETETAAGAKAVYARMERRARQVCRYQVVRPRYLDLMKECEDRLIGEWVDDAADARLSRLHLASDRRFADL